MAFMDVFTHIMRLTPHSVRSKLRGIKPEGIKDMKIQKKYIHTLIKLNFIFFILLFNFLTFSQILTEWNITSVEDGPVKPNRYKSCQNLEVIQTSLSELNKQKESLFIQDLIETISNRIKKKQSYIQKVKTCFESDNQPHLYFNCQDIRSEIKKTAEENWSLMRVFLALSVPAIREHRLLPDINTWLDPTPSHTIPGFPSMSPLNEKEIEDAKNIYLRSIRQLAFNNKISLEELNQKINKHSLFSPEFTLQEEHRIQIAIKGLRMITKEGYLGILQALPFLAYLKDEKDLKDNKSLGYAFSVIDKSLTDLSQKIHKPEADMGLLLSFTPIVEDILTQKPEYCFEAEAASVQSDKKDSLYQNVFLGSTVLVALPCMSTGFIGISLCILGEFGVGIVGRNWAETAMNVSLAQSFLESNTMAEVEQKGWELKLEKFFLPLGVWFTSAEVFHHVLRLSRFSRNSVIEKAEDFLRRPVVTSEEGKALWEAHVVGHGELGKDGVREAEIYNYTWGQIRGKSRVLSDGGFDREEREVLIGSGVVGEGSEELSKLAAKRSLALTSDLQWIREKLLDETGKFIREEYQGQLGYLKFVKEHFGQDASMETISKKVSKAFRETSIKRPNWKQFPGRVFEFEELQKIVNQPERYRGQHTGYPAFATEYVSGNMQKAYIRLSSILDKDEFKELGWKGFQGSVKDFQELPKKILNSDGSINDKYIGQEGYLKFAKDHPETFIRRKNAQNTSGSNDSKLTDQASTIRMNKVFTNVSAVLDEETFAKLGWQAFNGSATEFEKLIGKILTDGSINNKYIGQEGYLKFAKEHYSGNMQKTFQNVSAILDDEVFKKLEWQQFQGNATEFEELAGKIMTEDFLKEKYIGQEGYLKFAKEHYEGAMQKTFENVSAVLDEETFAKLGWQAFNGNATEFEKLIGKILTDGSINDKYIGQEGYLKFAKEHYGNNMNRAFKNVSAVLDEETFAKLGWQAFNGSATEFEKLPGKILTDGSINDKYIGQEGYLKFAKKHYGGNMKKTFQNVSAVLDEETFTKLGWQGFQGSTTEFEKLSGKILTDGSINDKYIGQEGYLKFAKEHYGGNMQKTFQNVSAVLDKDNFAKLGWQGFHGSATEFEKLPGKILTDGSINNEYLGQEGYLKFAKEHYGGNMQKTFQNVSAVLDKDTFPKLGWQYFNGSAIEFEKLPGKILIDGSINNEYLGQEGYLKFAKEHYGGNMQKTFQNVSAVLDKDTFVKLGWQGFQGNTTEFEKLPGKILSDSSIKRKYIGQEGYLKFAKEHYGNNMNRAFQNVSAVLDKDTFVKLGWQQFHGNTTEFEELAGKIMTEGFLKEKYIGQEGYLKFAKEHYGGAMQKTFQNVSAVLDKEIFVKLGWQQFHGNTTEFEELAGKIMTEGFLKEKYIGQEGYLKFAKKHYGGAMQKTFINISAVLDKETFAKLGWQGFQGNATKFEELPGKILTNGSPKEKYIGQEGYLKFAKEHYGENMKKTFQNVSAVLDKETFVKLGWREFHGSATEFEELIGK